MKVTLNSAEFEKVLRDVVRVVPSSTNKPALKHVLIRVDMQSERVDLYATSEDMSVRRTLFQDATNSPVMIEAPGACLLPAREFHEIVKKARGQILLQDTSAGKTAIAFGNTRFELSGLAPNSFEPYVCDEEDSTTAVLLAPNLYQLLRRTTYAVAKGEARPVLTGVNLSLTDTELHAVATDALRLAEHTVACQSVIGDPRSLPVPATLLDKLLAVLPGQDDDEEITVVMGPSACTISWGDDMYRMMMRGLSGDYPDTARIIPTNPSMSIVLPRLDFLGACERASILSETEHQKAEFRVSHEHVVVSSNSSQYGNARDAVAVTSSNVDTETSMAFNIHYWIALLRSYDGVEQVEVGLVDPGKPATIKPVGGHHGFGLISPIFITRAAVDSAAN